jgi:hypothetical protein
MLKLEPREASRTLLPLGDWSDLDALAKHIDQVYRQAGPEAGQRVADEEILVRRLGLSARESQQLRNLARGLLAKRMKPNGRKRPNA